MCIWVVFTNNARMKSAEVELLGYRLNKYGIVAGTTEFLPLDFAFHL